MRLVNPSRTSALLRKSGFRLSRDLGQNFLVDPNTMDKILEAAGVQSRDTVLEIGSGIGTLTVELAARAARVVTVELDARLDPILDETLAPFSNIKRLMMDAMDLTVDDVSFQGAMPDKLVANLPYGVAAPVVLRSFGLFPEIAEMTVMVQREVADRMLARPGTKDYSAFTVKLAYFCRPEKVMGVSRRAFMPPPNVDSTVVKLTRRAEPPVKLDRDKLFALITAGFSQRRKRLANAVGSAPVYRKEAVDQALGELGLAPDIRAERLDLADFGRLMEVLEKYNQAMH